MPVAAAPTSCRWSPPRRPNACLSLTEFPEVRRQPLRLDGDAGKYQCVAARIVFGAYADRKRQGDVPSSQTRPHSHPQSACECRHQRVAVSPNAFSARIPFRQVGITENRRHQHSLIVRRLSAGAMVPMRARRRRDHGGLGEAHCRSHRLHQLRHRRHCLPGILKQRLPAGPRIWTRITQVVGPPLAASAIAWTIPRPSMTVCEAAQG